MPVVLGSNSITIDGRVFETVKSDVYIRDTNGTNNNLTSEPSVILGSNIATVAAGQNHTIFLDTTGKVYGVGNNEYGQLGLGHAIQQTTPVPIPFFNNIPIQSISAGRNHTIFLDTTGKVYGVGRNEFGQLGLADTTDISTPVPIQFFNNILIQSISAGDSHTIFLDTKGKVYGVGLGGNGQLGLGDSPTSQYYTPEPIPYFNNNDIAIQSISAGSYHTIFLDTTGKVYGVGFNLFGQLGLGDKLTKFTPQLITHFNDYNIKIKSISAGGLHTIFLATTGKVYSVGRNTNGQLGLGDTTDISTPQPITHFNNDDNITIRSISAGDFHTIFLATTGKVYSVGYNVFGQLGLANTTNRSTPELIPHFNDNDIPIQSISAGWNHTIFLDTARKVYSVGRNDEGQLGLGNTTQQTTPQPIQYFNIIPFNSISAGNSHTIFLDTTGKVYSVGRNQYGQLGLGDSGIDTERTTPVPIPYFNIIPIQSIAAGGEHTIFLDTTGKVYSVGRNEFGQLGLGNTTHRYTPEPIPYFNSIPIKSIVVGQNHTIFLATTGKVYVVGRNSFGLLGLGNTVQQTTPQPISFFNNNNIPIQSISAGAFHTIFLATTGKVYGVGYNTYGQLGLGSDALSSYSTPQPITFFNDNDNISIQSIAAGGGQTTNAEGGHTIFLDTTGKVYSVGRNNVGQLGLGNIVNRSTPELITYFNNYNIQIQSISASAGIGRTIFLDTTGKVYSVGDNTDGQLGLGNSGVGTDRTTPEPMLKIIMSKTISISAGSSHTIFLDTTGKVYSVGLNGYGQLGLGNYDIIRRTTLQTITYFNNNNDISIQSISAGIYHTIFLDTNGKVYSVGGNNDGQLGLGDSGSEKHRYTPEPISFFNENNIKIKSIAAGYQHTIFLDTTGKVYSVGFNGLGQLGLGDLIERTTPELIPYFDNNNILIQSIAVGSNHTIFLATTGKVYSVGWNFFGQLGLGDFGSGTNRSTPQSITFFNNDDNITIQSVAAGGEGFHTIFLDITGKVYSVGYNNNGQLGLEDSGTGTDRSTPEPITFFNDYNIKIQSISAGKSHTIFLDTTGKVYSVGRNIEGQLGLGDKADRSTPELITHFNDKNILIQSISAGFQHTIFLATTGKVYSVGDNKHGQLGLGDFGTGTDRSTPEPMLEIIITDTIPIYSSIDNRLLNHKVFRLSVGHYRISLNTETVVDINNGSDIILKGDYNITVGALSSIIPDINNILQNIPLNPTANTNMVVVRYHLMTPVTEPAQWTYNSSNADVYHMGNVGIGTTNPISTLHIEGNTYSTTYSGGSKNFKIEHPLKINKWLYHGCIEGPRFDNIYRGKTLITEGKAVVDIDRECNTTGGMTSGTFPALNTNHHLYLRNNQTYDRVKGKISGSTINIESENTVEEIEIDWLVVGERHDEHVINTPLTDSDGNLICEHNNK